ncbi:MAG TPA: hypothetical protein VN836_05755, partial [Verrucomicrobiae bacterium]|nr:hypothetical protein [Verrucomicrobiae bacterium]
YGEILLDILRSEGVPCNPPHGIAFNTKTGEITTQNTPEKLEVFRRVIEQLNRADGKPELPLRDSPIHRQSILIEARFFWMPSGDFERLTQGLQVYEGNHGDSPWWSVGPERFGEFDDRIKSLNLKPFIRPRVQTGNGMTAEMYCGTQTNGVELQANGVEFDCRPMVIDGAIDLAFRTEITGEPTGKDQTLVGTNRYQIHGTASAEDYGGIVLHADNPDGSPDNLVMVLGLHIVTNNPSAHFQTRLQAIIGPQNGIVTNNAPPRFAQRLQAIIVRSNNTANTSDSSSSTQGATGNPAGFVERARVTIPDNAASAANLVRNAKMLYEMGKLDDAETNLNAALAVNPDNTAAQYYLAQVRAAKAGQRAGILPTPPGRKEIVAKLNRIHFDQVIYDELPLSEVIRQLSEQTKLRDPEKKGINFLINPNPDTPENVAPATPADQVVINLNLTDVRMTDLLDAIVKGADHSIKYSIVDYGVEFSSKEQSSTTLFTRTFKIDPETLFAGLRRETQFTSSDAEDGVTALKKLFSDAGVDLQPTNKAVFYNDHLGMIFVRATANDLDTIESIIARLNTSPTQIHIKARFVEVPKQGFVWPADDTNTARGILNAQQMPATLKMLEAKPGFQILAQPEVVTTSGRQTQMRATTSVSVVTNFAFSETTSNVAVFPQSGKVETGPVLDTVATVLPDGYTIDLRTTASVTEFMGYDQPTNSVPAVTRAGEKFSLPTVLPRLRVQQASTHLRLWDNQTAVLSNLPANFLVNGKQADGRPEEQDKAVVVFITVTIVDAAGNRVHTDDEMPFAKAGPPPQAY